MIKYYNNAVNFCTVHSSGSYRKYSCRIVITQLIPKQNKRPTFFVYSNPPPIIRIHNHYYLLIELEQEYNKANI